MAVGLYDSKKGMLGRYVHIYYITPKQFIKCGLSRFLLQVLKLGSEPNSRTQTGFELGISDLS
jgi:hypothetical protein